MKGARPGHRPTDAKAARAERVGAQPPAAAAAEDDVDGAGVVGPKTTVTLLLMAFVLVNVSVLVLRREHVGHEHLRVPRVVPILGVAVSVGLLTQPAAAVYARTALLLALGLVLWLVQRGVARTT